MSRLKMRTFPFIVITSLVLHSSLVQDQLQKVPTYLNNNTKQRWAKIYLLKYCQFSLAHCVYPFLCIQYTKHANLISWIVIRWHRVFSIAISRGFIASTMKTKRKKLAEFMYVHAYECELRRQISLATSVYNYEGKLIHGIAVVYKLIK